MADYDSEIRSTPEQRPAIGALARFARRVDQFARKPFGYDNPPVQMLSDAFGIPAIYNTAENYAYGSPLTSGTGQARQLNPEVKDALLAAPQFAGPLTRVAKLTKGLPVGMAIKPKGGNWLEGSAERTLGGLKKAPVELDKYAIREAMSPEDLGKYFAASNVEGVNDLTSQLKAAGLYDKYVQPDHVNNWIDKQLTRYVRNEMATPEDPIRALAEKGILHYEPGYYGLSENLGKTRVAQGYPEKGFGESELAKLWENQTDMSVEPFKAGNVQAGLKMGIPVRGARGGEEWINKLDPEANIYGLDLLEDELGFKHLIDEMRNATNPASGLPRELQLKYSSLPQVSVPQAVERVHNINEWRAAQKIAADQARAQNPATVTHKEYPEQGFKWVELKQPEAKSVEELTPKQLEFYKDYIENGISPEGALRNASKRDPKSLEEALKYEGETMGHCVGGYCPDVAEGRSRIFSLRDAKGEPHVTIETRPDIRPRESYYGDPTPSIVQIKGKANRAPKEDYLPFVQDFVRSGKWSDVGDIQNTGMRATKDVFSEGELQKLREAGQTDIPHIMGGEDIQRFHNLIVPEGKRLKYDAKGNIVGSEGDNYAKGGVVEFDPARVDEIAQGLRNYEPSEGLAPHGLRHSGDSAKGKGYFGLLPHASGMATEISSESPSIGEYPLIVPTLNREELDLLLSGAQPTNEIYDKAEAHALKRIGSGKNTFAQPDELHYPAPEKFAQGGVVEYNPAKIEMLAEKLREELHG